MAATQREREDFLLAMAREGVPPDVARTVLRNAATIQRCAELACSSEAADRDRVACPVTNPTAGPGEHGCLCRDQGNYDSARHVHGDVPRIAVQSERAEQRITKALAPFKVTPDFQGDPRGACVKLNVPSGRGDDWGTGRLLCVPA